jgi:CRP-like cAMP-binding protein
MSAQSTDSCSDKLSSARQSAGQAPLLEVLRGTGWGRALREDELERVARETADRIVPAGTFVCTKGAPVEHWVGVIDGLVKVASTSATGKTISFAGVPAGGWFGEGSVLKGQTWRYDAIVLRESRIAFLPRATFIRLIDTNIAFNRFLLEQINARLGQFIALVEYDRLLGPDARVARCLASLLNPHLYAGVGDSLEISQEELGYLSGLSRQRVNQALHVLESARLIRVEYGRVIVLDLEGLRSFEG